MSADRPASGPISLKRLPDKSIDVIPTANSMPPSASISRDAQPKLPVSAAISPSVEFAVSAGIGSGVYKCLLETGVGKRDDIFRLGKRGR